MKKLLFVALLGMSASGFAQVCQVDMVDRYNRVIQTFTAYGDFNCFEGMKECRKTIRFSGRLGEDDCVPRAQAPIPGPRPIPGPQPIPGPRPIPGPQPIPQPMPQPFPQPIPQPMPQPVSYDARRMLQIGESVIYSNARYSVVGMSMNGVFAIRDNYGFITNNLRREQLSVTSGCNLGVCVDEPVVSLSSNSQVKIAGLAVNDTFTTVDNYGFLTPNVSRQNIAVTKGCLAVQWSQICVGNQVIDQFNSYKTVAALQMNGLVVLRDQYGFITANIDPSRLVITR